MFTDRNGRPCQASDDSLVAAMFRLMPKNLEETVMFTNGQEGFQELIDRLLAYSSTKQSVKMSESKKPTRKDDPMDVDALSKGKSKGKGKKVKGQNHMSKVVCWNRGKSGYYEKDCRQKWTQDMWWSRAKGKGKMRGDEQANGWWKATDWQSSGQWMSASIKKHAAGKGVTCDGENHTMRPGVGSRTKCNLRAGAVLWTKRTWNSPCTMSTSKFQQCKELVMRSLPSDEADTMSARHRMNKSMSAMRE